MDTIGRGNPSFGREKRAKVSVSGLEQLVIPTKARGNGQFSVNFDYI